MPDRSAENDAPSAPRVLVLEDELLLGMDLVMQLEEWGYDPVGPLRTLAEACAEIERAIPDVCLLDVNLGRGETSIPLAKALADEGVPFVFMSGYEPSRYADDPAILAAPHLRKPVSEQDLRRRLAEIVSSRTS